MTLFNPKNLNLADIIKHHCNIEAQIECQLYSDPEEKNHLDFTLTPPIPKVDIIKVKKAIGWKVFFNELKC